MFALDLFNTPYEKALKEGAVDKNECMGYGTLVGEDPETEYNARQMFDKHDRDVEDLGIIGQGEHWAGIQRAKQRRDEKDKEKKPGVAEESSQVGGYPQSPRAYGVGNFQRIVKANMGNLPTVTLEFADPNDNIVLDRKGVDLISDYYDGLENDSVKNHFIYRVLPSADEVLTILKRLGWHDAVQPELPGIPKQSELPLQEKKRLDKSPANASDTRVARELQKLRSQYPSAKNDLEVVAKAEIDSDDRSRQQLSAIKGANREQDRLLQQLIALDQKQGKEIDALDNENDRLEQHLANIEQTNDQLAQAIGQASGSATKKTAKDTTAKKKSQSAADRSTAPAPAEPAKATDTKQAEPKSAAIDRMAQDLTQPRKVQGIDQGPAPSIRGTVSDLDAYRRAQAAVTNKKFEPLARAMVDKGAVSRTGTDDRLNEFAPGGGGGSGDYLRALASAWYNGVFDTGSLPRGIKTQEDVERLLNRGIVCPDGKTRKLHIDYNSDFDGVEIYSDDYYEHGDESGELDSRTGQPWGPWDHMEFRDEELDEGVAEGLNEFAPDGFNGGDDGEEFNPRMAKMAYDEGVVKGASLADGATLQRAMAINDWVKHDGGIYKQHFAKGFKAGRMDKIRHNNKQYNLNLKLMKDGSIRHGEQGVAEGEDKYAELSKKIQDLAQAGKEREANKLRYELNRLLMLDRDKKRRQERGVAEGMAPLSVQQLATISDEALDKAYGYGRSTPGNTFGWQANLKSAAYAKKMIDKGVTDIEAISDAIHKGWNTTAQAFVQNPDQFDDTAKLQAAGKLEAKLQQRAQLMKQNYAQLPEEEKEKDRVVARALLQAIKGEQGVEEAIPLDKLRSTGTRVKDEVSAKLKQNGPLGRDAEKAKQNGKSVNQGVAEGLNKSRSECANIILHHTRNIDIDGDHDEGKLSGGALRHVLGQKSPTFDQLSNEYGGDYHDMVRHANLDDLQQIAQDFTGGIAEGGYNDYDNNRKGFGRDNAFRNQERNAGLEGETNNIQISINGKPWKVIPCRGYADSKEEWSYLQNMKEWAAKKSAQTGKKWTVSLTGAPLSEDIAEHIGKVKDGYRLYSHTGKNLGTFGSKAGAEKHEREVQYFKHLGEDNLSELSNDLLGQYKKAAGISARDFDRAGKYSKADKRFKGIVKATVKQFDNDLKKHKTEDLTVKSADSTSPVGGGAFMESYIQDLKRAGYDI